MEGATLQGCGAIVEAVAAAGGGCARSSSGKPKPPAVRAGAGSRGFLADAEFGRQRDSDNRGAPAWG